MNRKPLEIRPLTRREVIGAGAVGAAGLLIAGCGGDGGSSATTSTAGRLTKPAGKPRQLVVRTWGDPWEQTYAEGPGAEFTRRTGIPVRFDTTDFNEIQAKVSQSVRAGRRPPVDVVLTIETSAFTAEAQKLSVPLDPTIVTRMAELNPVGRPTKGTSYVNISGYTQPIIFDPARAQIPEGASIDELFDPKYRNRLFIPSTSPEALLPPVAKALGVTDFSGDLSAVWKRLAELRPNIAAAGDEEEFISGIQRKQFDVGVTLVATAREVKGLQWRVPSEGASLGLEAMYVVQGLPDDVTYYAQEFVNDVIGAKSMSRIADALGEVPTHPEAVLPDFMKGDPAFPFTAEEIDRYALRIPPETLARNNDSWSAEYSAALGL